MLADEIWLFKENCLLFLSCVEHFSERRLRGIFLENGRNVEFLC